MSHRERRPRLVLVGPGHTHLEILRRQSRSPLPVELTVVTAHRRHHYSGMVPGYLQGTYEEEDLALDVPALAAAAGGEVRVDPAVGLDPERRRVRLASGGEIPYDLVSVAVGSTSAGFDRAEIAEDATLIKPLERVVALRRHLEGLEPGVRVAVVGGGAAGVEIALAVHRAVTGARLSLVEAAEDILGDFSPRFRNRVRGLLEGRGIEVCTGRRVVTVTPERVRLEDGRELEARCTIWLAGAVGFPWLAQSGLPVDERGFLLVDRALRSVGDARVFAAGDCATLEDARETPKAGVQAVRQAPVLWRSLKASLGGGQLPRYEPQESFLALLNTADGKALLRWKGLVLHNRFAWWLKDWIDRRFMARYRRLTPP